MSEVTGISAKVSVPGKDGYRTLGSRGGLKRLLTLDNVKEMIRNHGLDEYTTNGLIELASKYPTQALPTFRKNFNLMIQRVRAKRKLEQRGMENASQESQGKEESIHQHEIVREPKSSTNDGPDVIELS